MTKFGFAIGDLVKWQHSDADVSRDAVGAVVGFTDEHVRVRFSTERWLFKPGELTQAANASLPDDPETSIGRLQALPGAIEKSELGRPMRAAAAAGALATLAVGGSAAATGFLLGSAAGSLGVLGRLHYVKGSSGARVASDYLKGLWPKITGADTGVLSGEHLREVGILKVHECIHAQETAASEELEELMHTAQTTMARIFQQAQLQAEICRSEAKAAGEASEYSRSLQA